jgi:CRISPR-associated protein Cst2
MSEKKALYSLSISACAILDMHSLNNEGGEGNQIQTRMVDIVAEDGKLYNVNAISGDMFKHIQAEHLYRIAKGKLPLCAGCQEFNANRISADEAYTAAIAEEMDAQALDRMLTTCAMDDLEGNLITAAGRSIPRKSVVEFSWVVGLPEVTRSEQYFHVKYVAERSPEARAAETEEARRRANLGQAIFYRPASSGIYAIVCHLELARIGYNDLAQLYAVDDKQREARHQALLESVLYTFVQPNGAMRSTQLPHIVGFNGVVSYSTEVVPAPTISPLNGRFAEQIKEVAHVLNELHQEAIVVQKFEDLAGFAAIMRELIQTTVPYKLAVA